MFGMNAMESKTYGVKFQARCIAAQTGEKQVTRFLIGTLSLREENEVHLIQLSEDGSSVVCEGLFGHQHEIWDLAACPFDPLLFSTVYAAAGEYTAALWRMPRDRYSNNYLEQAAQLPATKAPVKRVLWHADPGTREIVSLDEDSLRHWDLSAASSPTAKGSASAGALQQIGTGAWAKLSPHTVATTSDASISLWDLRTMSKTGSIDAAHNMQIRDLDFSPCQENVLVSGMALQGDVMSAGDDSKIRIWDLRNLPTTCLAELPGHAHWVWRSRYNPFHDDLVLSAGTDSTVNLWHVPFASKVSLSRPATVGLTTKTKGSLDQPAASFTDFEDSVYGIAWSAADPWMFASLSYDGRVVVDIVPPTVRSQVGRAS